MSIVKIKSDVFNHDAQAGGFFPSTHMNPGIEIDDLLSDIGQNRIIEGTRGTGKTHILKKAEEEGFEDFADKRILPIYISLAEILDFDEGDIEEFRISLYTRIVLKTIQAIKENRKHIEFAGSTEMKKSMKRLALLFKIPIDDNFDKLIEKIENLSSSLIDGLQYNTDNIKTKIASETDTQTDLLVNTGALKAGVGATDKATEEEAIVWVGKTLAYKNASKFIVDFFMELVKIMKLNYVSLLADECSEVSDLAQKEVFKLLKLIRGSSKSGSSGNFLYFIATAYPPQLTYYPSKASGDSFNFDLGQDCSVDYLQLDEVSDTYEDFFKGILDKRLNLNSVGPTEVIQIIEEDALFLATYAANGIPRRFLEILKQSYGSLSEKYKTTKTDGDKKISLKEIAESIDKLVSEQITPIGKLPTDEANILENKIVKLIKKRNLKVETESEGMSEEERNPMNLYFSMDYTDLKKLKSLIQFGSIHNKSRSRSRKTGGNQGQVMMLDIAVAYQRGALPKQKAIPYLRNDLKENAEKGFRFIQDFKIE